MSPADFITLDGQNGRRKLLAVPARPVFALGRKLPLRQWQEWVESGLRGAGSLSNARPWRCRLSLLRHQQRIVVRHQLPSMLPLYPYSGEAIVTGNCFASVLPNHG
jgi:hypothetical protein